MHFVRARGGIRGAWRLNPPSRSFEIQNALNLHNFLPISKSETKYNIVMIYCKGQYACTLRGEKKFIYLFVELKTKVFKTFFGVCTT